MKLLHYGLQRSGTNFLKTVIEKKYRVNFLNSNSDRSSPLQKHFRLYDNKNVIPEPQYQNNIHINDFESFENLVSTDSVPEYYLVISKDPYSWFLSYKKWADKCNWPKVPHHYIEEYNLFYGKWLDFVDQTDNIFFVKYINLLKDTALELEQLEDKMGLKKKWFASLISSNINKVSQSSKFTNKKKEFYINEKYLDYYSKKDFESLNNLLDSKVISLLGYEKKVLLSTSITTSSER